MLSGAHLCLFLVLLLQTEAADQQVPPAGLPPAEAVAAFDAHVRITESRLDALLPGKDGFLWADTAERRQGLRQSGVICEPRIGKGDRKVPGALIHHWVGATFIPGATTDDVLSLLQDYNHHTETYQPEVIGSKILERQGNDFKVRLRLLKRKVVTVVLDTDSQVHYQPLKRPGLADTLLQHPHRRNRQRRHPA